MQNKKIRFFFDVESQSLHGEGFAFGYVVMTKHEKTNELIILEKGECYSIEGARGATDWVQEHVIPSLSFLSSYLKQDLSLLKSESLPSEVVVTTKELRDRFFEIYKKWKDQEAEFWTDVNFPVESNFLSEVVKDGKGTRDWQMPYALLDVANFLDVKVDRNEYSELKGLQKHNPLDDILASAYSLYKYEAELMNRHNQNKEHRQVGFHEVLLDVEEDGEYQRFKC
ncbi:hypothetical protein SDB42_06300 [Legionella pneumophila serogroup 1]|nr:hypothetical protein [Legionella pneumophila]